MEGWSWLKMVGRFNSVTNFFKQLLSEKDLDHRSPEFPWIANQFNICKFPLKTLLFLAFQIIAALSSPYINVCK